MSDLFTKDEIAQLNKDLDLACINAMKRMSNLKFSVFEIQLILTRSLQNMMFHILDCTPLEHRLELLDIIEPKIKLYLNESVRKMREEIDQKIATLEASK